MRKDLYAKLDILDIPKLLRLSKQRKKRILIFGNFGANNLGDEAILAGQLEALRGYSKKIVVVGRFPDQIENLHRVKAVSLLKPIALIHEILLADLVIFGGGGIYWKSQTSLKGIIFQFYISLLFLALPLLFRKKVFALGIGFYSNTSSFISLLAISLLKKCKKVTTRDLHSQEFLVNQSVKSQIYKDNSFLMPLVSKKQLSKIETFNNFSSKIKNVGLALKRPNNLKDRQNLSKNIVSFISNNLAGTCFWFYCLDKHPIYINDYQYAQSLIKKVRANIAKQNLKSNFHFQIVPSNLHPQLIFSSFKLMNYIVAMRLHASIFSYRQKVKFSGLSYDLKCTSFLESIGKEPIPISKVSAQTLQADYLKTVKNKLTKKNIKKSENMIVGLNYV